MTFKIKFKKLFGRNCILDNFISRENLNYRGLDPDLGDPNRPDPTGSGSATLVIIIKLSPANLMSADKSILSIGGYVEARGESCVQRHVTHFNW